MVELSSSSFEDGQEIPRRHGKRGENVSPELSWSDPPPETQSFALAMVDTHPDAAGYVHWLVADIDPETAELPEGAAQGRMPDSAVQSTPYAGPNPPSGTHDYEVTLYALATPHLELPRGASLEEFLDAAESYALDAATLVGSYHA
jgi:Raf kinase inhibitor-like YbhB/YbcL family protein